ncbi:MAG: 1-acyl-sn-glycerol-3-phosphate acyltransferase [Chlamydiia bacterium]|nr:1-acyl-sn-glycerol-3-phosphate acyltransferase [Chlamydiia bacterium]
MKPFYWLTYYTLKPLFKLFYHHQVFGQLPSGPAIIAANHTSFIDPPLLLTSIPEEVHFLARPELFNYPFLRFLITRLNATSDLKSLSKYLLEGKKVLLFPEGNRSYTDTLAPFQEGAAHLSLTTQVPIIPCYLTGTFSAWPRTQKWPHLTGHTTCTFLSPLSPKPYLTLPKKEARAALTAALRTSIEKAK